MRFQFVFEGNVYSTLELDLQHRGIPMRKISRLCVEVPGVDDDVGVGRRVLLDPLHGLDRLNNSK